MCWVKMCERRVAEYEEELSRTKEKERRQLLDAVFKKPQGVLHITDVPHLIGCQQESLTMSQGGSSGGEQPPHFKEKEEEPRRQHNKEEYKEPQTCHVKQEEEYPQPNHFIEEEEGDCLLGQEEADLTKFPLTVVSVKTADHEDQPPESSQLHHSPNVQKLIGYQEEPPFLLLEGSSLLKQEDPHPPHIKEEEENVWITQERECLLGQKKADLTKFPLTVVSVKTEDKPPESSQLHHSPSEEKREVEPPSRSSPQHMTTEADGDHCGGSQVDNLLAPLSDSDDSTSHINKCVHHTSWQVSCPPPFL
ncbi:uncharacterized protein LOC133658946 isoform X3 [Entelurus aequoreus]|uniref:uncharacterized protein LOC133658946 isoform X3 n=1 Tax=Entelurus aequoreus TaxID=161455 RepID=UPI002B1E5E0F|nr:uncharacterized protein LOC133658946 isoform X3 [Entelurus aequoreus]